MPLTTAWEVRRSLGIDHTADIRAFRYTDEAELEAEVDKCIAWAVAWLSARVSTTYYTGTAGFTHDALFKGCEEDMAGYWLLPRLKIRKTLGTHYSHVSEDSARYEALIDEEIPRHVEMAIDPFVSIDTAENPYAAPFLVATGIIDRTELISWPDQLQETIDQSIGAIGVGP